MIVLSVRCFLSFRFHHNRSQSASFQTFPIDFSFLQGRVTNVLDVDYYYGIWSLRHRDNLPSTGSTHGGIANSTVGGSPGRFYRRLGKCPLKNELVFLLQISRMAGCIHTASRNMNNLPSGLTLS